MSRACAWRTSLPTCSSRCLLQGLLAEAEVPKHNWHDMQVLQVQAVSSAALKECIEAVLKLKMQLDRLGF